MADRAWNQVLSEDFRLPAAVPSLRRWVSPRSILVVTDGRNEDALLLHTMAQAAQSRARIILAYLATDQNDPAELRNPPGAFQKRLQWAGIRCQSIMLSGPAEECVPSFAARAGVDRVLLATPGQRITAALSPVHVADRLLPLLRVPVCVIGNAVPPTPRCAEPPKRVALALSMQPKNEVALRFACELCREWNALLTVVHVFAPQERRETRLLRTPTAVSSELPDWIRKKTPISCALQIAIREGEAAHEIVNHAAKTHQDLILMCSPGSANARARDCAGLCRAVLSESPCPVMVIGRGLEQALKL